MPEDLHRHPGVHVQVRQERGASPSGVPDGDPADAGCVTAPVPEAVEVARLDRPTVAGGEDQIRRLPGRAGRVGELAAVAGSRSLRLRRGRSGSRMAGAPPAGDGPWVVAVGHPACPRPGRAEQTTAPQEGGSRADGMARRWGAA